MKQTPKQFFSTQEGKLTLAIAAMVLCWTFFIVYLSKTDVGDRWFPTQKKIDQVKQEIQAMTGNGKSASAASQAPLAKARTQKAEIDKLKAQDLAAKATYWNADRDGQPEIELRNLVSKAAERVEANLQNLGSVRMSNINSELSYADLEFTVVDEYDKVVRLIAEIEKCRPRLSWRSVDIRVENSRARAVTAANRQTGGTTTSTAPQMFRTTMRVRVIKYSPAGNASGATRTASAAKTGASAPASASTSTKPATTTSAATSSTATQPAQAQPAQPASADTPAQKEPAATATNNKENEK